MPVKPPKEDEDDKDNDDDEEEGDGPPGTGACLRKYVRGACKGPPPIGMGGEPSFGR